LEADFDLDLFLRLLGIYAIAAKRLSN